MHRSPQQARRVCMTMGFIAMAAGPCLCGAVFHDVDVRGGGSG